MHRSTAPRLFTIMETVAIGGAGLCPSASAAPSSVTPSGVRNVKVSVECSTDPEKVIIRNDRKKAIKIKKVGSTYGPRNIEPFTGSRRLKPGRKVTFSFGTAPGPNKLTRQFILSNAYDGEKAKVWTNLGRTRKRC